MRVQMDDLFYWRDWLYWRNWRNLTLHDVKELLWHIVYIIMWALALTFVMGACVTIVDFTRYGVERIGSLATIAIWLVVSALLRATWVEARRKRNAAAYKLSSELERLREESVAIASLSIEERALGLDHPNVAVSLYRLAELYDLQGRYAQAEPLYKRSLAIREKTLGLDHPVVATSLNSLAELYRAEGQYAQAEPLYKRALAIREKSLAPNHLDVARVLNNLAELYRAQGQHAQAVPLYERALAIEEKALGADYPGLVTNLEKIALLYRTTGRVNEAEALEKRAVAIRTTPL
jgi:tetratricopeptide (TPR) repeat protein